MNRLSPELVWKQIETLPVLYEEELPEIISRHHELPDSLTLSRVREVHIVGNGDSLHAGWTAEALFKDLASVRCRVFPAFRYLNYEVDTFSFDDKGITLIVGVSASGSSSLVLEILNKAKSLPNALFISVSGSKSSPLEKSAPFCVDSSVMELGRTPGLRSYAASFTGLASLALAIKAARDKVEGTVCAERIISAVKSLARSLRDFLPKWEKTAHDIAPLFDAPFVSFAGSGQSYGSALFSSAKFAEVSGIFSSAQDLEEWLHVESNTYPADFPLVVFAAEAAGLKKGIEAAEKAGKIGHSVVAVTSRPDLFAASVAIPVPELEYFAPLGEYIFPSMLSAVMASRLDRGMFRT